MNKQDELVDMYRTDLYEKYCNFQAEPNEKNFVLLSQAMWNYKEVME